MTAKAKTEDAVESVLIQNVKAARRVSTPLIAISTADQAATILALSEAIPDTQKVNGTEKPAPKIQWDVARGLQPVNEFGRKLITDVFNNEIFDGEPVSFLQKLLSPQLPPNTMIFFLNAQRFFESTSIIQGIWNCRDVFKEDRKMLVLLGPEFVLPVELAQDIIVLDEPLPDRTALSSIISETHKSAKLECPKNDNLEKAIDAVQGLSAFTAEQVISMSLRKDGLDILKAWSHKKKMIENTSGLSVWCGGETFEDVGGVSNVKSYASAILKGRNAPNAIVFIDEIEKAFAGLGQNGGPGDSSGVTQDYLGTLLSFMQDKNATGMIFIGPPGSAKSMVAKAAGSVTGIPTIQLDLSGMKGSLVGQSEQNLRSALKTVSAVSNNSALFIATCNSIHALPPELRRRFKLGTFFFDLPSPEEREVIWNLYFSKYGIDVNLQRPNDDGWTGAEIAQCCDNSYRLNCNLLHAAKFVVPVAKSAENTIRELRRMAHGKFISASYEGFYNNPDSETTTESNVVEKRKRDLAGFED